MIVTWLLFNS